MTQLAHNSDNDSDELCPSCGQWVTQLSDEGWCYPCSGIAPSSHCIRCLSEGRITPLGANNGLCNRCKYVVWLETNADAIDRTMAEHSCNAATAKKLVLKSNRPTCLSCGSPIKGGTKDRHLFCSKKAKCKKAQNAYRYYKVRKNCTHEEALEHALYASTLHTLIDKITKK